MARRPGGPPPRARHPARRHRGRHHGRPRPTPGSDQFTVYHYLSMLQGEIVDALAGTLPRDGTRRDPAGSSPSWARGRRPRPWSRSTGPSSNGSGPERSTGMLLDTPFGFQTNAPEIAARAVDYFRDSVGATLEVAGLRSAADLEGPGRGRRHRQARRRPLHLRRARQPHLRPAAVARHPRPRRAGREARPRAGRSPSPRPPRSPSGR